MQNLKNIKPISTLRKLAITLFLFSLTGSIQSSEPFNFEIQTNTELSEKANDVSVTYVGNAGFLITIGDKKILIDALFKGFAGRYELPQNIQEKLTLAQAPFDNVDLILVTHAHGDHINIDMVQQHLKNNPNAIFASTQQTVDALNAADTLNDFQERSIAFNPIKGESDIKDFKAISIESFYLPHGPDSKVINIGFLVSVNGITFFQTGDVDFDQFTFDEFRSLLLPKRNIDLSFIQHYYLRGDSLSDRFVKEAIGGKYIFPIHYHFTTPAFDTTIVRENYPDAIIFKEELQSWKMPVRENDFTNLKVDYLGQTPPGDSSIIFAPGIVSVDSTIEHGYPTFSPDGNEVFWQVNSLDHTVIHCLTMKRIGNVWTTPKISPYDSSPVFSPDGKRLYYLPFGEENGEKDGPHFVEKEGDNWSQPVCMDLIKRFPEIKAVYNHSFTSSGTLYFLGYAEGYWNNFGIYRSELIDGMYGQPELLPAIINIPGNIRNWTPFIAPDESYLLFSSSRRSPKTDTGDIYISFRNSDGSWTVPVLLGGNVNSDLSERFPSVSPDGKYLFFTRWLARGDEDVMWVRADIIDRLQTLITQ